MGSTSFLRWRLAAVVTLLAGLLVVAGAAQADNPRYAGIVIDADTHEILYAENADAPRYPASLTKMMTLYLLFEALEGRSMSLDDRLPVSAAAAAMPATKLYLKPGERLPVETAIESLVVKSANDVAVVVAEALGGSEAHFARMMTDRARELGMDDTTFRNASGLPDDRQVTTARDMAVLSRRLMLDFPQYYPYFSLQRFAWRGKTYRGHNRLLANYPGTDGLKTGFIRASGFNVATSAVRDGRRMLSVVMGGFSAASRDEHMAELLDRGFVRASLADGSGWLANTAIAGGRLMPGAEAPMQPAGQMLASLDTATTASATPVRARPASAEPAVAATANTPVASAPAASAPAASAPAAGSSTAVAPSIDETLVPARPVMAEPVETPPTTATSTAASAPVTTSDDPIRQVLAEGDAAAGGWGVQIGAFSDADHARRLAARAADRLATELANARVAVPRVDGAGVYRARLVDMQEGQARSVCRRLQAQGMDCMVVQASL
ncbi:D-alanyl-D-alanine carboxypeptidase family protein [Halomonas stenophila]|uniref:D-alanyl-D-alanine carboxypeptidase n=1 Tax=Halomonas stenophila TaxID=795312 RepID=A0A7W5HJD1_9GAMM|nr:D-alanyl-D-alanine carboxypeptidase family protein [Halomonas stenophila]MBB3230755.1 D-alanyl-D-alanine carboxypeptidase [Halomonas stenophila]